MSIEQVMEDRTKEHLEKNPGSSVEVAVEEAKKWVTEQVKSLSPGRRISRVYEERIEKKARELIEKLRIT